MPHPANFRLFNAPGLAPPPPALGFSHVAEITGGKLLLLSGQLPLDAEGRLVGPEDFAAQVAQVFFNVNTALAAAGATFRHVVKLSYYCSDRVEPAQQAAMREVRDRYINVENPPASTFVVVHRLVRPEYLIEIEAMAVV